MPPLDPILLPPQRLRCMACYLGRTPEGGKCKPCAGRGYVVHRVTK